MFTDGDARTRRWWRPLLKPGFRHCWALTESVSDICVEVELLRSGLEVRAGYGWPVQRLREYRKRGARILTLTTEWTPYLDRPFSPLRRGAILTCSSVVGFYLGASRRCLTPWELWQHLTNRGAEEI